MQNVGAARGIIGLTMVQVARAVRGEVVTHREVMIVGEVKKPQVVTVAIGTPVADLKIMAFIVTH